MAHTTKPEYVDRDRRVALYKRMDTKQGVWQARFRIEGTNKYKRVSTGKYDFEDAKHWALKEFQRWTVRVNDYGEAVTSYSFKELAGRWLEERRTELERKEISQGTFQRDKGTVERYLLPFFGTMKPAMITQSVLDDYREWRENYWITGPGADRAHKTKRKPETNTIRQENISLRMILKKATKLGQYRWEAFEQLEWRGQSITGNRREHFADDEFKRLTDFMRRSEWLEHPNARIAYGRKLLREYVLIMKNTGMRVGEARELRWRDVQERTGRNGEPYLVCLVDGKRGKRTAVCNDGTERYFERLKELTGRTAPSDWVWATRDGDLQKDFSVGFKSLVRAVFGADDERTLYCLRHTYATKKIVDENISTKRLAEIMGTSEAMIDQHYGHYTASDYGNEIAERRRIHKEKAEARKAEIT